MQLLLFLLASWSVGSLNQAPSAVRMRKYDVNMTVQARFASTVITVKLENDRDCLQPTGFTLRLPLNARVTSLSVDLSSGCSMSSVVDSVEGAKQTFKDALDSGKAAAMMTAWSSTSYKVQVIMPPKGNASVVIKYGELLKRRRGQVDFMLPLNPNGWVAERTVAKVTVLDSANGVRQLKFAEVVGVPVKIANTSTAAVGELEVVSEGKSGRRLATLPPLLDGSFDTGLLPEAGFLMSDNAGCLLHLFNPPSLQNAGALRKNIVFVIDVSGSMSGQKLADTKVAFSALLKMLTAGDVLAIHSFSTKGVEAAWGPSPATSESLSSANDFVSKLAVIGGTNLLDAYLDGIARAADMQATKANGYVPIMVIMTDGQGNGRRDAVAKAVTAKNAVAKVKIFALAFGQGADFPLLLGIALQNGGVAVPIYEGFGDAAQQMENFIEGEMGKVLLADIAVSLQGAQVTSQTQTRFPLLADGSEIAVRAKLPSEALPTSTVKAITSARAYSNSGGSIWPSIAWTAALDLGNLAASATLPKGDCTRAFAHAKIAEMMQYVAATDSLGDILSDIADQFLSKNKSAKNSTDGVKAEALQLALEAGIVWPGLTAMIAVQSGSCQVDNTTEVCAASGNGGNGGNAEREDGASKAESAMNMASFGTSTVSAATTSTALSVAYLMVFALAAVHLLLC